MPPRRRLPTHRLPATASGVDLPRRDCGVDVAIQRQRGGTGRHHARARLAIAQLHAYVYFITISPDNWAASSRRWRARFRHSHQDRRSRTMGAKSRASIPAYMRLQPLSNVPPGGPMPNAIQSINETREQARKQTSDLCGFDFSAPAELFPSRKAMACRRSAPPGSWATTACRGCRKVAHSSARQRPSPSAHAASSATCRLATMAISSPGVRTPIAALSPNQCAS